MIALLARDLRLAVRAGGGFGLGLAFFLIVTVLVPFGVGPETELLARIAPGILWIGALLACLLSLDRILALDWQDGSLDLLATAPLPLEALVSLKALAHWITTGLPLVLAAPALGVLLRLPTAGQLRTTGRRPLEERRERCVRLDWSEEPNREIGPVRRFVGVVVGPIRGRRFVRWHPW